MDVPDLTMTLVAIAAIAFVGALTQSAIGFGFAIVFTPLVTLLVGAQSAVATSIALGTLLSLALIVEARPPRSAFRPVLVIAVLGTLTTPLGVWVLAHAPEQWLRGLVALAVLSGAVVTLRSHPRVVPHGGSALTASIVGFLSGILRGATSMGGPPVVLYLHWLGGGPIEIRHRLFGYFALFSLTGIPIAWWGGVLGGDEARQALVSGPLVLTGVLAGRLVRPRLSEAVFRGSTVSLLVATSVVAIAQVLLV